VSNRFGDIDCAAQQLGLLETRSRVESALELGT
jgi:hypothetical protein